MRVLLELLVSPPYDGSAEEAAFATAFNLPLRNRPTSEYVAAIRNGLAALEAAAAQMAKIGCICTRGRPGTCALCRVRAALPDESTVRHRKEVTR